MLTERNMEEIGFKKLFDLKLLEINHVALGRDERTLEFSYFGPLYSQILVLSFNNWWTLFGFRFLQGNLEWEVP